jgi:hypothetical protein
VELKPIARYREPAYPTSEILLIHPELLHSTPVRWQRQAVLLSVLASTVALVIPARAQNINVQSQPSAALENQMPITMETPPAAVDDLKLIPGETHYVTMGDVMGDPMRIPQAMTTFTLTLAAAERQGKTITAPVRLVDNHLGAQVVHNARTGATTIVKGKTTLVLTRGRTARLNGTPVELPAAVRRRHNTLYAPVRFLAETFGASVQWSEKANKVDIIVPKGNQLSLEIRRHRARPVHKPLAALPQTLDQRRAALHDYIAWLKSQQLI